MDHEIRSAPAAEVSSEGLATLLQLLQDANTERRALKEALHEAEEEGFRLARRFEKRRDGFLLKHLFPAQLARFEEEASEAAADVKEMHAQLEQTAIKTEIQAPQGLMDEYEKVRQSFEALCRAGTIWDVIGERKVDARRERSSVGRAVTRERVEFYLGRSEILAYSEDVPVLRNRNGGDIYLYPGFVLFVEGPTEFALVDVRDLSVASQTVQFTEGDSVPLDAERVGTTWLRVNADGSQDRRFQYNPELPVVAYGSIRLQSKRGLDEEYQVSNAKLGRDFGATLQELISAALAELGGPDPG